MNSNMTNVQCNPFSASLENVEQYKHKVWKVWLKNIRDLGTVTPVTMEMLMSVLMLEISFENFKVVCHFTKKGTFSDLVPIDTSQPKL